MVLPVQMSYLKMLVLLVSSVPLVMPQWPDCPKVSFLVPTADKLPARAALATKLAGM